MLTLEKGANAKRLDSAERCARIRSKLRSEKDVLAARPVTGSIDPLFSPLRDILPPAPSMFRSRTSSSGLLTGSERRRKSLTRLKIAVFAPMPIASESTATTVNPGLLAS